MLQTRSLNMNCKVSLVGAGLDRVEGLALSIKALMESANFDFNANQEIPALQQLALHCEEVPR